MRVNHRELLIQKAKTGLDPIVDEILLPGEGPVKALYEEALQVSKSKLKRTYVEASLLCSTNFQAISDLLEIDIDVLHMYHDVFYNVTELDKLSKLELLDTGDRQESLLKIWAVSQGLDFISWRLGNKVTLSPIEGLTDLFTTCVYKAKEAMYTGNAAEESKEAVKWVKLSADIARLLKVWTLDVEEAKQDIELALKSVKPEFESFENLNNFPDITEIDLDS